MGAFEFLPSYYWNLGGVVCSLCVLELWGRGNDTKWPRGLDHIFIRALGSFTSTTQFPRPSLGVFPLAGAG